MTDRRTDLDAVVEDLRECEAGDTVTLATDAGSITATVETTQWRATDTATVVFADRGDDRRVRVTTEWYGGWLDPLVDVAPTDAGSDSESDSDVEFESPRPVGTLVEVRLVAAAADQHRWRSRP